VNNDDIRSRGVLVCHELKTDPFMFQAVWDDEKRWEMRFNDRNYYVGDIIILEETRYSSEQMKGPENYVLEFTGRSIIAVVTWILHDSRDGGPDYGLKEGWVVMSIRVITKREGAKT
jgi:hypothetical protein